MNILEKLEGFVEQAKEAKTEDGKVGVGFGAITPEDAAELMALTNGNGEIEIDGATIKIVKPDEALPKEVLDNLMELLAEDGISEELKEFLDENKFEDEDETRRQSLLRLLCSDEATTKTDKLAQFLVENDYDFADLLSATINIGITGYSNETIEATDAIKDRSDYFDYIDDVQIEMRTAQTLIPTNPVRNATDLMNASLLSALDCLMPSENDVNEGLMIRHLIHHENPEAVAKIGVDKLKLVARLMELGRKMDFSDFEESLSSSDKTDSTEVC